MTQFWIVDTYDIRDNDKPDFFELLSRHEFTDEDEAYAFVKAFNNENFYIWPEQKKAYASIFGVIEK